MSHVGQYILVRPLLPQYNLPVLHHPVDNPPHPVLHNRQESDVERSNASLKQTHRQHFVAGQKTGGSNVRDRGVELLPVSDPVPRVHTVDHRGPRRAGLPLGDREVLQHIVLLQNHGLFEFGD